MTEQAQPNTDDATTSSDAPATQVAPENSKKPRVHPRQAVKQFSQAWPEVFSADFKNVKPLAIGILQEILKQRPAELDGLNSQAIRSAMKFYTSRLAYHHAMLKHEHRINLDGSEAETIDDGAREHAQAQIEAIQKVRAERQKNDDETENTEGATAKKPRDPREKTRNLQNKRRGRSPTSARKQSNGADKAQKPARRGNTETTDEHAHLSMEEKLDRLAQHFGKPGAK